LEQHDYSTTAALHQSPHSLSTAYEHEFQKRRIELLAQSASSEIRALDSLSALAQQRAAVGSAGELWPREAAQEEGQH
jgi:hypothetical protein